MSDPIVIALDLSTNSKEKYVVQDGFGTTLMDGRITPVQEEFEELMEEIREKRPDREIIAVIESTGMSWFPVSVILKKQEVPVYRVKAQQSEEFRTFLSKHAKTDEIDARALAKVYYAIPEQLYELWLPLGEIHSLRRVVNRREDLVRMRSKELARLQEVIKWALPTIGGMASKYTDKKMREIITKAVDYRWMCTHMGKERFIEWAKKRNPSVSRQKLETLFEAARKAKQNYQETEYKPEDRRWEVKNIITQIQHLDKQIKEIQEKMMESYKQVLPEKPVESVYGVSSISGAVLKAYLGDGSRFPGVSEAEAWVSFIPEVDQSSETDRKGTDIRKDGPPLLRKFLYMITNTARQWDPQIAKKYYKQMVENGKTHTQAVCSTANSMLRRILRVLDDGEAYELRDNNNRSVQAVEAKQIIKEKWTVPEEIRKRRRNKSV